MNKFDIVILGGNISSLILCKIISFKTDYSFCVLERRKQKEIPDGGFLYFHSNMNELGLDLETIEIYKSIYYSGKFLSEGSLFLMNKYSKKTIGYLSKNSILDIKNEPEIGWIFKHGNFFDNFNDDNFEYDCSVNKIDPKKKCVYCENGDSYYYDFLVNTIPLSIFLKLCGFEHNIKFLSNDLFIYRKEIDCLINLCVYVVSSLIPFYRFSIINGVAVIESNIEVFNNKMLFFLSELGFDLRWDEFYKVELKNGRFLPIDGFILKTLFRKLTDCYNIFCLGRNGSWTYKRSDHIYADAVKIIDWMKMKKDFFDNKIVRL